MKIRTKLITFIIGLPIILSTLQPAIAENTDGLTERDEYIIGNAYHVVMHEIGHMLIDQLRLAVLGQEEDAADNFATVALIEQNTDFADNALANTAHFWFVMSEEQNSQMANFFDEHDLDIQRAYRIVCHLVGVDAQAFDYLAKAAELSPDKYESCGANFEQTADSWFDTMNVYKPKAGEQNEINLEYEITDAKFEDALFIIQNGLFIEDAIGFLNTNVKLPAPVTIRAESCGEPNASYDNTDVTVTICFELIDLYGQIFDASD